MNLDKSSIRKLGLGLAATTEMIVYVLCGYGAGYFLDRWFEKTTPWMTVLLTLVGLIGGFYRLYRILVQNDQENGNNSD